MNLTRPALAGLLALLTVAPAAAQQFPTIPAQTFIGRLGLPGDSGPSQAIPFSALTKTVINPNSVAYGVLTTNIAAVPSMTHFITLLNEANGGMYQALNNVGLAKSILTVANTGVAANSTRLIGAGGATVLENSARSPIAFLLENGQVGIGNLSAFTPAAGSLLDIRSGGLNLTVTNPTLSIPVFGFEGLNNFAGLSSVVTLTSAGVNTGTVGLFGQVENLKGGVTAGIDGAARDSIGSENYGVIGTLSANHNGGTGAAVGAFIRNTTGSSFIPNPTPYSGTIGVTIGNEATAPGIAANGSIGLFVYGTCDITSIISGFCPNGATNDNTFVIGANILNARDEMIRLGSSSGNGNLAPSLLKAYAHDNSVVYNLSSSAQITSKNSAAPSAPGAGYTAYWTDSTTGRLADKSTDGSVGTTINLAQTITDTKTGGGTSAAFLASAATPGFAWQATGQATDQKNWDIIAGANLAFRAVNDANSVANAWMTVTRGAGATVSNIAVPILSINPPAGTIGQGLNVAQTAAGTPSAGFLGLNNIIVSSDTMNNGDGNEVAALRIRQLSGGSTVLGQRTALHAEQVLTAATNPAETQKDIVGGTLQVYAVVGNSGGNFIGGNSIADLFTTASGAGGLTGHEIDIAAQAGSSVVGKYGLTIVQISTDAVQGSSADAGILLVNNGSAGWKQGLAFGAATVSSGGVAIDMSALSAGGPAYLLKGPATKFYVDGNSNIGGNTLSLVGTPSVALGSGSTATFSLTSTNTGFQNSLVVQNGGTVSNGSTVAASGVSLSAGSNTYLQMVMVGGATPTAGLQSGTGATGGLSISAGAGVLSLVSPSLSDPTFTGTYAIPTTKLTGALQAAQEPAHTGDVTNTAGSLALTIAAAQPAVHTWALAQTFTVAPVFTDQSGSRTALGLGTAATQNTGTSGANVPLLNGTNTWSAAQAVLTAAVDTNTTQAASTAFVIAQAASATPLIDGTAAVGTSTRYARGDHVHPTDTTRAPLASPTFTGTVTIPSGAALGTPTTLVATNATGTAAGLTAGSATPTAPSTSSPTPTCSTGSGTLSSSIQYVQMFGSKWVNISGTITVTTIGSCGANINVALPVTAGASGGGFGGINTSTGKTAIGAINPGAPTLATFLATDGTGLPVSGSGQTIAFSGGYFAP